jgi:hypothetical protein
MCFTLRLHMSAAPPRGGLTQALGLMPSIVGADMHVIDWTAAAAWVQAIGSIVAIAIAIWVPFKINNLSLAQLAVDKAARARIFQASLLPTLYRLRSTTADFLQQESGEPSFLGVDRESDSFDSDFFELVPEFTNLLTIAVDSGSIQQQLTDLSVLLFKTKELLSENSKLQRDGYHAAWINHKDLFIDAARDLNTLSSNIIVSIELPHDKG